MHRLKKIVTSVKLSRMLHDAGLLQQSIFHHDVDKAESVGIYNDPAGLLSAWTVNELAACIGPYDNPIPVPVALFPATLMGEELLKLHPRPYWVVFTLTSMKDAKSHADAYAMHLLDLLATKKRTIQQVNDNLKKYNS